MVDPAQTTPSPSVPLQAAPIPNQSSDFFGGGEEAFKNGAVVNPHADPQPFVPEERVWEPKVPEKPVAVEGWKVEGWKIQIEDGNEEIKIEKIEPIPEPIEEPVIEPIPAAEPVVEKVVEPEIQSTPEPILEPVIEPVTVQEKEPMIEATDLSDLGKKFMELIQLCKQINEWKKTDEGFELIWADNDKLHTLYKFVLGDPEFPMVSVTKIETDKTDEEETVHELTFYLNEAGNSLNINLDEELLFEEEVDLQDNVKKKMEVMEKINKFIFLVSEESKKIEKEIKEKQAEQEEKRKLQDIFRNF